MWVLQPMGPEKNLGMLQACLNIMPVQKNLRKKGKMCVFFSFLEDMGYQHICLI